MAIKAKRIREWMTIPGQFNPGLQNCITDVPGVSCAHETVKHGDACTGLTLISLCDGDVYLNPVPAAVAVGNGFGKLTGALQINELGTIESLVGLTNTLSVAAVLQGLVDYHTPKLPAGHNSINIVVGETNDGQLNNIRACHVKPWHVKSAVEKLSSCVEEGSVGAGTGTVCYGYKGGIGTASRIIPAELSGEAECYVIGALVQSNYGGELNIYGHPIPKPHTNHVSEDGSCMIVIATNAPLSSRQLNRLAKRGLIGMTNTGSVMTNGSGDFCIAASNYPQNRHHRENKGKTYYYLSDNQLNPFFRACVEAVQESLYNSLTMAGDGVKNIPGLDMGVLSSSLS